MSAQDKRRYARIHFEREVHLDFPTQVYDDCQVRNISMGGLYVLGKFPHKVDEQCYINLAQKGQNIYLTFKALAKIVRHDEGGIGLEYVSMSFESLLSLEMILLYEPRDNSSDSEMELPENLPFEIIEEDSSILDL